MNQKLTSCLEMAEKWQAIRGRISQSCLRVNRSPDEISVVAVTKSHPLELVRKGYAVGMQHFGENRVQEAVEKYGYSRFLESNPEVYLHMIGHLQRNKVRKALQIFNSVDSVDNEDLARILDTEAGNVGKKIRVLLEVNTSREPQKFGVIPESVMSLVSILMRYENLQLAGLMTVGPNVQDEDRVRDSFRLLKEHFDSIAQRLRPEGWLVLSMGMSGDFEIAIEEGATELRLGSALFGQRRNA